MSARGKCPICFGEYLIRKDGMIRHHSGPLVRDGRFIGSGYRCSGVGEPPYSGPVCAETGKLCPRSRDLRLCAHDDSVVIAVAWLPPKTSSTPVSVTPGVEDAPSASRDGTPAAEGAYHFPS